MSSEDYEKYSARLEPPPKKEETTIYQDLANKVQELVLPPRCRCPYSYGGGPAVGPQTGGCSWELLRGLWRAVAPLMTPWCSERDVPTSANLNLHGGSGSCVRWHSDDEALFGERGDPKLIVSVSPGSSALHKWKPRSCSNGFENSCWLHRGDLLVMDGCCQDEYLHCTDPRLEGEQVNVTIRWIRNHSPGVPWVPGWCVACPHALRAHLFSPTRVLLGRGFFLRRLFWSCWEESCCRLRGFSLQELVGGCGLVSGRVR